MFKTSIARRGFTLIELVITITIAAILVALALPSYRTMILNNRQNSVVDASMMAMNYARNAALTGNQSITLCANGGGGVCGAGWNSGWIVTTAPAVPIVVLTTTTLKPSGPTVKTNGGSLTMLFDARGLVTGGDIFVVCDSRGSKFGRAVSVNTIGYVQASAAQGFLPDGITATVCP